MDDRWLSLKEIAEYLGARRETIYKWIENKNMPGHRTQLEIQEGRS